MLRTTRLAGTGGGDANGFDVGVGAVFHAPNTTIEQGRARVGNPTRETGSGLAIDVYQLKDGSEVWLGYAGSGGLIYATHGDQQLLPDGGG